MDIITQCTHSYVLSCHASEKLLLNSGESTWYYFQDGFEMKSDIKAVFQYFISDIKMNAQKLILIQLS